MFQHMQTEGDVALFVCSAAGNYSSKGCKAISTTALCLAFKWL